MNDLSPAEARAHDIGALAGQRRALSFVAGRCSAAHAEILRKIRDEKLFRPYAPSWAQYCGPHLHISRRHADRIIALFKDFGPLYFELAELTGITPEQYRRVQPNICENGLQAGAEVVAINPANSTKIIAAVQSMLQPAPPAHPQRRSPPGSGFDARLSRLEQDGRDLAARFEGLLRSCRSGLHRARVFKVVHELRTHLADITTFDR